MLRICGSSKHAPVAVNKCRQSRAHQRTVWWAREPDWRGSRPGHPGVRGQSWMVRRPTPRPCQSSPACHHKVGGHEAGSHHTGCQAARQWGRVHLSKLCQLLGLSGRKRNTLSLNKCDWQWKIESIFPGFGQCGLTVSHTPLPEHFLLLALQSAGQQSVIMVTSALLPSLLICDGFRHRGGRKRLDKDVHSLHRWLEYLNPDPTWNIH